MGRRSSSSGARTSSSRGSSGFFSRSSAPAPRPQAAAPAAQSSSGGGMMSGLAGSVMHGMASGVGWSMASRAVDAVVGPRSVEMVHRNESAPQAAQSAAPMQSSASGVCQVQQDQVNQCIQHASDISYCQSYFEALKQCQTSPQ